MKITVDHLDAGFRLMTAKQETALFDKLTARGVALHRAVEIDVQVAWAGDAETTLHAIAAELKRLRDVHDPKVDYDDTVAILTQRDIARYDTIVIGHFRLTTVPARALDAAS